MTEAEQWQTTDERIQLLETQVETLVQAVHALIEGLERNPVQDPEDDHATRGARLARELLLARRL